MPMSILTHLLPKHVVVGGKVNSGGVLAIMVKLAKAVKLAKTVNLPMVVLLMAMVSVTRPVRSVNYQSKLLDLVMVVNRTLRQSDDLLKE